MPGVNTPSVSTTILIHSNMPEGKVHPYDSGNVLETFGGNFNSLNYNQPESPHYHYDDQKQDDDDDDTGEIRLTLGGKRSSSSSSSSSTTR